MLAELPMKFVSELIHFQVFFSTFSLVPSSPQELQSWDKVTTVYNVHERLVDTQTMVYIMKHSNGNAYNVTVGDQKLQ